MSKVIYWNCLCAIFSLLRCVSTFIRFGSYCFLSLCLMIMRILNKIIYEKLLFSHKLCIGKTYPLSWRRSCYWRSCNWSEVWCRARFRASCRRWLWCKTTEKIIFCRWFLCWNRFRCSRVTNFYILKNLT